MKFESVIWHWQSAHLAQALWYFVPSRVICASAGYTVLLQTGHFADVAEPLEKADIRSLMDPVEDVEVIDEAEFTLSSLGRLVGLGVSTDPPNAAARSAIEAALDLVAGAASSSFFGSSSFLVSGHVSESRSESNR